MANELDKWFVDAGGTIRDGLILHGNVRTPVGDYAFFPAPYGQGKGRLVRKLVEPEEDGAEDREPRELSGIMDLLEDEPE